MVKMVWGEGLLERNVSSALEAQEVIAELNDIALEQPFIVDVTIENGDTISIGLGRNLSVLSFTPGSLDPPYFASEGRPPGSEDGVVCFLYHGAQSEFPEWQAISLSDAVEAVNLFVTTGFLPNNVTWRSV